MDTNTTDVQVENDLKANAIDSIANIKQETIKTSIDPVGGWIDVKDSDLPYKKRHYPKNYTFQIKPSDARLMKYFSTLDIENPLSVQEGLIYVVENYVRVIAGKRLVPSLEAIYETDKFFFTLLVHNFSGSPQRLAFETKSPHSGKNQEVEVTPFNLIYSELDESIMRFFDDEVGTFKIDTKNFGYGVLNYKPQTIEQGKKLADFSLRKANDGGEVEKLFIDLFGMFDTEPKIEDSYNKYYKMTQDPQLTSLLLTLSGKLQFNTTMEVDVVCETKKLPFRSPITNIDRLKDIFTIRISLSEL